MTTATMRPPVSAPPGIPQHAEPEGTITSSSRREIDAALRDLVARKHDWAKLRVADRLAILGELVKDFSEVSELWAERSREAEGLPPHSSQAAEEWLAGPYMVIRNLKLLERSLREIQSQGQPRIPGPVVTRPDGQVTARVFPQTIYDQIFYTGVTAEVWMEPEVTVSGLADTQATAYKSAAFTAPEGSSEQPRGAVSLVLGAGNVSSIGAMDLLYKLFVQNHVTILKMHPLNVYLGPILAEGFQALIDWGVLRIVYGGGGVGAYLTNHPEVDEIHITGSDKTVEAIVFGPGEEGRARKAERRPKLEKAITSELGNVSAVIVVPGPWSGDDIEYHAENLASTITNNAGFNCNATRVMVQHESWPQRGELLDAVRRQLSRVPVRKAYYPGAGDRHAAFLAAHPEAETFGSAVDGELPWTLIPGLEPDAEDEICFHTEAFCGLTSETVLAAESPAEFIARAVELTNNTLWGTLNATLLVHPKSMKDPQVARAVDRAISDLRYGTVAINCWAAVGYGLVVTPWGAYPGQDAYDIQSGSGIVHNTMMFDRIQKSVVRAPFRMSPKPPWFPSHRTAYQMSRKLTDFEADPAPWKLPGIFWEALRG